MGRILGAAGARLGACLLLFTPSSRAPSPKKSGDRVWVRGDHDLHCPLAHPEHHPPPPQISPGIRQQQGEPGVCGGCFVRGRLSPPLSLHAPGGRCCHPGSQQKRGPGRSRLWRKWECSPRGSRPRVAWACSLPSSFTVTHPALPGGCSVTTIGPQGQVTP